MRLTFLMLFVCASALFATEANSQTAKVSITARNTAAKKVIQAIEEQTDYLFVYDSKEIDLNKKVSIDVQNETVAKVLHRMFQGTDIVYAMEEGSIMLMKSNDKLEKNTVLQTTKRITGKVTDAAGQPIIGANVMVKGTQVGSITDLDGAFSLSASEKAVLQISFIGYTPVEVTVGKQTFLKVTLEEDSKTLDEVVVVGYGTQKKVNLTAAVETVNRKALENRPVKSVAEMLEGVVPNLNVSTTSGAPDATSSLNIRGFTGMNAKGSTSPIVQGAPLVLVDGVELDINFVNSNDIESISVLKDAAASAIYGSRAPYGVILITTKSGVKGKRTAIQYSGTFQLNQPSMLPKSASSVDFANWHNRSFRNSLSEGPYSEAVIQKMQDYIDGKTETFNDIKPNGWWGEHFEAYANTDYYDYAFRDVSRSNSHDLNLSGGTDKTSYYAGLGYNYKQGIYNSDIDDYRKYSAILKLETEVTDWLSFSMNTRYVRQKTQRPNYRGATNTSNSDANFMDAVAYYPNIPVKNPDGSWHRLSAMQMLNGNQGRMEYTVDDFWITGGIKLTPLQGLTIKGNLSWNAQSSLDDRTALVAYVDEPNGDKVRSARSSTVDKLWKETDRRDYYTMDLTTEYHRMFGKHDLTALVGIQSEYSKNNGMTGTTSGMYTQSIPSFNMSWGDNVKISDAINHWSTMGAFFRLSYNYESRYLLDVNGRYDAASKYPSNTRWAFFPSVSAGWNVAREKFWPIKDVSTVKLTASFGKLGDQGGGNYLYLPTMTTGTVPGMVLGGQAPKYVGMPGIVAERITWAKPQTLGFGVEVAALNNRLKGEYYWYQRTVYDQLGPSNTLPQVLGTTPPKTNNAVSETRGWEMSLSWRDQACVLAGSPLNYGVRFVLSDYIGYVVSYPDNVTGAKNTWTPGEVFGRLYGYKSAGIATDKETLTNHVLPGGGWYYTGDLLFQDLNGDGVIDNGSGETWYSTGDLKNLGYTYPRMKYSISFNLDWKNIYFSMFLDGVGKEVRYINNYNSFGATNDHGSRRMFQQHVDLGYWSEYSKDAFFPRAYTGAKNFANTNDKYLIDLSHLRIKNLTVGYTFPSSLTKKMKINNLSLNLSIENLGFIYNNSWLDLDPQMIRQNGNGYPIQRTYSLGVKFGI